MKKSVSMLIAVFLLAFTIKALANTDLQKKGLAIVEKQEEINKNYQDEISDAEMVLINQKKEKIVRRFVFKVLEDIQKGDKTVFRFKKPADIRNTALLTHQHNDRDDDQWLYLPELKRVKRISARSKNANFMGSEFTYEDLSPKEISKYAYVYLKDEPCAFNEKKETCHVIESKPLFKHTGYSKIVSWITSKQYQTTKQVFYDKKDQLLKEAHYLEFKKINDRFWRAGRVEMKNLQNQKETLLINHERKLSTGLKENQFTRRAIQQ